MKIDRSPRLLNLSKKIRKTSVYSLINPLAAVSSPSLAKERFVTTLNVQLTQNVI